MVEKKLCGVNGHFKCLFGKKLFVCLTFFESADARDLGIMTLFSLSPVIRVQRHFVHVWQGHWRELHGSVHIRRRAAASRHRRHGKGGNSMQTLLQNEQLCSLRFQQRRRPQQVYRRGITKLFFFLVQSNHASTEPLLTEFHL